MKRITFYLDFVSPYAWLAFERLPEVLMGLSYSVAYKPVLLGALLQQHGNPGPAGIGPKRDWTYRHVAWLGHAQGTPLQMPARHPFNPLPLLRQALACSDDGHVNRFVAGSVLRHVWQGGQDALDAGRLAALAAELSEQLRPGQDAASAAPKALLRANTEAAQAAGVFGVPTFEVDGKLFWGLDGLPMLRAYLDGDAWFDGGDWEAVSRVPSGLAG
ncbi:2-hydroxychromene-2-carboxylate isomerase [Verminephrobacter aporrectodeae]|uniref:2-hydroxychromene-2-carboxylate isomerase n=1 Tax=Verminephrobacter aporrectodeae TaxID=1110389 RepID=UPI00224324C2|nr:2-hydroxychromene-2-carboxylate isomerase [Verminephrobacter aporrectodeae]MCW8174101.1 2-hydroxychromene-2-carboxylate isomerase [Verminephrobacter aporrectodeae subsp. tuberculatae]MCW8201614.1 2-hydroxychromene-2-carboxylate isomerase [Verminephrobacter aporrectodeae subsp. tuberculatae]